MTPDTNRLQTTLLVTSFLLFGGFFDYTFALCGLMLALFLLAQNQRPDCRFSFQYRNPAHLLIPVLLISVIICEHKTAISPVLSLVHLLVPTLFFIFTAKNNAAKASPDSAFKGTDAETASFRESIRPIQILGLIMTTISLLSYQIPGLSGFFWQADRLGGIFQYSGTCALFLILCIMLTISQDRKNPFSYVSLMLYSIGLLLTGSRGPIILFLLYCLYKSITDRKLRKGALVLLAALPLCSVIALLVTKSQQNIGRLTTALASSSTLWGRILYHIDGIKYLMQHPTGLGHLGYSLMQGSFQHGVYTTRYVHDDLLQTGLDYGVLPMIMLIAVIILELWKGKQSRLQKEMLAMIVLCSMVDFNLQYLFFCFVLILCLDTDLTVFEPSHHATKTARTTGANRHRMLGPAISSKHTSTVFCAALSLCFAYLTIPFTLHALSADTLSLKMMPIYTDAAGALLAKEEDPAKADVLAKQILENNPYDRDAINAMVYLALMNADASACEEYILKNAEYNRYDIQLYRTYDALLPENSETKNRLRLLLLQTENETDPIAYRLKDQPEFDL